MTHYPSIFNDVLGPVMRGPSSSHCAAALRIGRLCRDLMNGDIRSVLIEFDPEGSLVATHEGQGSDMGLLGGLLGWEAHDARLPDYRNGIRDAGIDVKIEIRPLEYDHPNTYKLTLENEHATHELLAISTGGGMIEVVELDGVRVEMRGDCCELLVYCEQPERIAVALKTLQDCDAVEIHHGARQFVRARMRAFPGDAFLAAIRAREDVEAVRKLAPVLPVMSSPDTKVPFLTCEDMLAFNENRNLALWELGAAYESARGGISTDDVMQKMHELVAIMGSAVDNGLAGTEYDDRILGCQSTTFRDRMASNRLIDGSVLNQIILYVTAIMETKSAMGVIVAAPTAGACGALPGAVLGAASAMASTEEDTARAMLAAGMIGVFISANATFAAEVGGCQAECGSGGGMAAAALVGLAGGSFAQSISAASVALQNSFGMVCDPVANRVEAPCLGKNVMAASNALSCANMALANYDHLIPLDEVIDAMDKVGKSIPNDLRCTSRGGLSTTKTSRAIEARLAENSEASPVQISGRRFKSC